MWASYSARDTDTYAKRLLTNPLAFLGIHVDQHSIRGLPLAAVAGHCVTIVKVRVLADVESHFLA